jgi:hypothetical protein
MVPELSLAATEVPVYHDDGTVTVNPDRAVDALYHRCSASIAADAIGRHRPIAGACYAAAVADPAWLQVEASYLVSIDDQAIPPALQRKFAARVRHGFEINADHAPFYSATPQLVEALAERVHAPR